MDNMLYNVYKNISDKDFKELEKRLEKIQSIVTALMEDEGFVLTSEVYGKSDGLGIDYVTKEDSDFMGNIGFSFNDFPGRQTFRGVIIKSYDHDGKRFYKREILVDEI